MPNVAEPLVPVSEAFVTVVIIAAGFIAGALALLKAAYTRRRQAAMEWSSGARPVTPGSTALTDAAIGVRVAQMAAMGTLPPGWSARDAARLLRVHGRRASRDLTAGDTVTTG